MDRISWASEKVFFRDHGEQGDRLHPPTLVVMNPFKWNAVKSSGLRMTSEKRNPKDKIKFGKDPEMKLKIVQSQMSKAHEICWFAPTVDSAAPSC